MISSPTTVGWALNKEGPGSSFPSPFCDYASTVMPRDIYTALKWAEFLVASDGTFLSAISRIAAYFVTNLIIGNEKTNHDEAERWKKFASEDQDVLAVTYLSAVDGGCYGNGFLSIIQPFRRYLNCNYSGCGASYTLEFAFADNSKMHPKFENGHYILNCARCGQRGRFRSYDMRMRDFTRFRIHRWSPHEMRIIPGFMGSKPKYRWIIPEYVRRIVKAGRLDALSAYPQEMIDAICKPNTDFEFAEGEIIHFKLPTLAGIACQDWGFPPVIHHLRKTWLVRMLNRQNEGISADYIIPMRIVTPESKSTADDDDLLGTIGMDTFARKFNDLLRKRREDPTTWNTMPIPIKYMLAGGEAKNLVPYELLDQAYSTWMDAIGAPVELFKGTLSMQAMSQGLRVFESRHRPYVRGLNRFVQHVFNRFAMLLRWQPVQAHLDRITMADDLERKSIRMQLAASRLISPSTMLETVGMNFPSEQRKLIEDDRFVSELQKDMQKDTEQEQMSDSLFLSPLQRLQLMQQQGQQDALAALPGGGGAAAGGAQGGGSAGAQGQPGAQAQGGLGPAGAASTGGIGSSSDYANMSPPELQAEATRLTQEIAPLSPGERRSQLNQLKQRNELIWKITSKEIEQYDNQARRIGRQQFMAQFSPQGGGGQPPA